MLCQYYQAHVPREKAWLFVGILRSYDHLVFERTLDKEKSIFEFFVPADLEHYFLDLMENLKAKNLVCNLQKYLNRYA